MALSKLHLHVALAVGLAGLPLAGAVAHAHRGAAGRGGPSHGGEPARLRLVRAWWFHGSCTPCWLAAAGVDSKRIYLFAGKGPVWVPRGKLCLPTQLPAIPARAQFSGWRLMPFMSADRRFLGAIFSRFNANRCIAIWNLGKPEPPEMLSVPLAIGSTVLAAAFSRGDRLVAAGWRSVVFVWNRRNGRLAAVLKAGQWRPPHRPRAIVFIGGHRLAAAVGGWIFCWNYATGHLVYRARLARWAGVPPYPGNKGRNQRGIITSMVSVKHGRVLACGWLSGWGKPAITFCTASNGRPIRTIFPFPRGSHGADKYYSVACMERIGKGRMLVGVSQIFRLMSRVAIVADRDGRVLAVSRRVVGGCFYVSATKNARWFTSAGFLGARLWRIRK